MKKEIIKIEDRKILDIMKFTKYSQDLMHYWSFRYADMNKMLWNMVLEKYPNIEKDRREGKQWYFDFVLECLFSLEDKEDIDEEKAKMLKWGIIK